MEWNNILLGPSFGTNRKVKPGIFYIRKIEMILEK